MDLLDLLLLLNLVEKCMNEESLVDWIFCCCILACFEYSMVYLLYLCFSYCQFPFVVCAGLNIVM